MGYSRHVYHAVAFAGLVLSAPAHAGLFNGVSTFAKMLAAYHGRPAQDLLAVIGYPNKQETILDDTVLLGGFDSESGPACTWKVVVGPDRIIKTTEVFGNAFGCDMLIRDMKKAIKASR